MQYLGKEIYESENLYFTCWNRAGIYLHGFNLISCQGYNGASQVAVVVKNSPANVGDTRDSGLILGAGRSPGEGDAVFLPGKFHGWGSLMGTVYGVAKNQTWSSTYTRIWQKKLGLY